MMIKILAVIAAVAFMILIVAGRCGMVQFKFFRSKLPSGTVKPFDSELLLLEKATLKSWPLDDLRWLINYAGHKQCKDSRWGELYTRASGVLHGF